MPVISDIERRQAIKERMDNGKMLPVSLMAAAYGVTERTIQRDIERLRSDNSHWLDDATNDLMIHLFRETWNGYYTDLDEIDKLYKDTTMKARDKEVQCMLLKARCDIRKDQLGMLMKIPVAWNIDRIVKSAKIVNLEKGYSKAIYGEKQSNTHIDIEQTPPITEYRPPVIQTNEPEE